MNATKGSERTGNVGFRAVEGEKKPLYFFNIRSDTLGKNTRERMIVMKIRGGFE